MKIKSETFKFSIRLAHETARDFTAISQVYKLKKFTRNQVVKRMTELLLIHGMDSTSGNRRGLSLTDIIDL